MKHLLVTVALLTAMTSVPVFGQQPPTPAPDNIPLIPGKSQPPVSKSDEHRVVGKVLEIDQERGLVKLQTDDGVVVSQPSQMVVRAFRVGDTVSVPRSTTEGASASPRNSSPRTKEPARPAK